MFKNKLVKKYYLLAVSMLIIFIFLGFTANMIFMRALSPRPQMLPPLFIAKMVDRISQYNNNDKIAAVKDVLEMQKNNFNPNLEIYDETGKILYPDLPNQKVELQFLAQLTKPYDYKMEEEKADVRGGFKLFRPPGPPPHGNVLIRLEGRPIYYLKIKAGHPAGSGGPDMPLPVSPLVGVLFLVVSLMLGVAATIFLIYSSIAKHIKVADGVISELQRGNLKARFPVTRHDEFGQAMLRFNKMASEIELLVERMRKIEQARVQLMQELTHDLKTPIASLKGLLETLDINDQKLDLKVKKELLNLSLKEINYFEKLIEDLLFLAQVSEPKYKLGLQKVNLIELLNEEIYDLEFKQNHTAKKIKFIKNYPNSEFSMSGDSHLLRRLFRNALENAVSFAKAEVRLEISSEVGSESLQKFKVQIYDDGLGFSPEALLSFGEKRLSRKIDSENSNRVSIGLGSVVMKTVVQLHRGELTATNQKDKTGQLVGALLEITVQG